MADNTPDVTPTDSPVEAPAQEAPAQEVAKAPTTPDDIIFPEEAEAKETDGEPSKDSEETAPEENKTDEPDSVKSEEESEEGKAEDTDKPSDDDEEAKKRHNDEMARQRIREKSKAKEQVSNLIEENFQSPSEQELQEQGMSPAEAKLEAYVRQQELKDLRNEISELNATLSQDAASIKRDAPVYDPESPEYDAEFAREVDELYAQAADLQTEQVGFDASGKPIEVYVQAKVPLHDFYSRMAKLRGHSTNKGAEKGQQDALKMLSRAEAPTGGSETKATQEDPELAGFDKVK